MRRIGLAYYGLVALGAAISAIAFTVMRVVYYLWMDFRPEMSPMMFLLFSPLIALLFSVLSVLFEVFLFFLMPRTYKESPFVVGSSYSAILLGLINPWLFIVFVIFNPLSLHWWLAFSHERAV